MNNCELVLLIFGVICSGAHGMYRSEPSRTSATLQQAAVISDRYQALVSQLNENFKNFVANAAVSGHLKSGSDDNEDAMKNSLAFEEILNAANENRLNYGPVIENMDTLLSQQMPERVISFIKLVKEGNANNRQGRVIFQSLDAWLDVFSAIDLSEIGEMAKQAPQLMKGITDLIGGIVKAVDTVGEI